ncbi:hypothetical protein E2C01_004769 [Portunus trituberculatus]|uniref:Uncharacterized protein n=1 Tax=Portunus trituberculatus TaxID=210409 RepID=A0A5B7CT79_PORTR|nr:hypothetical protein [Portunus trituberculatus]
MMVVVVMKMMDKLNTSFKIHYPKRKENGGDLVDDDEDDGGGGGSGGGGGGGDVEIERVQPASPIAPAFLRHTRSSANNDTIQRHAYPRFLPP